MNRRIRVLSFFLALVLLTGCTAKTTSSTPSDPTATVSSTSTTVTTASTTAITQTTTTESDDTTKTTTTTKTKISVTATYTTRTKPITQTIPTTTTRTYFLVGPCPHPLLPKTWLEEGTTPLEHGLDFGGKTYRYAYRGTAVSEEEKARIADFEQTYHVTLQVDCLPENDYVDSLLTAKASGKTYDILRFSGRDFPTPITKGLMTPLDEYLTKADLYDETAPEEGGFSASVLSAMSANGHIYGVSGVFSMDPVVLLYNKRLFGENDLLTAACKDGKVSTEWTWERLHPLLLAVQDRDNGVSGLASHFLWYIPSVLNSYGTDVVKTYPYNREPTQNLNDPLVYEAFETVQKYYCGDGKVVELLTVVESETDNFLRTGAAAAVLRFSAYDEIRKLMEQNTYAAFGSKEEQFANVGIAPLPNFATAQVMDDYVGYGAGDGATKDGILCALAFAKHEAVAAYHASTAGPSWLHEAIGSDQLYASPEFSSNSFSSTDVVLSIAQAIAKDQNITVVLKGHQKWLQAIIDKVIA